MDHLLEATARAEERHFWFHGFRRFVTPLIEQSVAGLSNPAILDCGCGTGYNLPLLRRYGHAVGIDLTASGLAFARARGERRIAQASAVALPFPPGSFDLITSFDVLTTLPDGPEATALAEMFRALRPGGHLVVNVAALQIMTGNHSILAGEVRRYTRDGLGRRLRDTGFEIRRLTYTNASIAPLVAVVRMLQRISGHHESQREIGIPPAPVNMALTAVLRLEASLLRAVNMPFGSSLLALARRPA